MRVALDTAFILGRGAVKDTDNLLADGIVKLMRRWRRWRMYPSGSGGGSRLPAVGGQQREGRGGH